MILKKINFNSNYKITEARVHSFFKGNMNCLNTFLVYPYTEIFEAFKKDIDRGKCLRYSVECKKEITNFV